MKLQRKIPVFARNFLKGVDDFNFSYTTVEVAFVPWSIPDAISKARETLLA